MRRLRITVFHALLLAASGVTAAVLPEERADLLYHYYDGGGVTIQGPSLLVRKNVGRNLSVAANYYVDSISSASIDVVTGASEYREERTEMSLGVDYLHDRTMLSLSFTTSDENDFNAKTASFGIIQDFFGGMTTLSLGYSHGWDEVTRTGDDQFFAEAERRSYRLGLTQVVTRNLLMAASFETMSDEGFLNNPYRTVRYLDSAAAIGFSYQPERYPATRTSNALGIRARYFLPYRASIHGEYRYFSDTWGIDAHTAEVGYTHPLGRWVLDAAVRHYSQGRADFFSDLFARRDQLNFLARDKELSSFTSTAFRVGASYEVLQDGWSFIDRGSLNLVYDHILFDYSDFRDLTSDLPVGTEPFYNFGAHVIQLYFSVWF